MKNITLNLSINFDFLLFEQLSTKDSKFSTFLSITDYMIFTIDVYMLIHVVVSLYYWELIKIGLLIN
jgi:hypothetical protein